MAILYVWSGAAGSGSGADWTNAKTTMTAAFTTEVAGDTLYVAHDHSESSGSTLTLSPSGTVTTPTKVICVNRAGTVPPVSADRRTTAQIATTTNIGININGGVHYDGIIFVAGNSTGAATINVHTVTGTVLRFDNCSLRLGSTGASKIVISANPACFTELNNTTVSFSGTGQTIQVEGQLKWRNTATAVIGTAVPTTLFTPVSDQGGQIECSGVDFSALGSGKTICGTLGTSNPVSYKLVDCKLDAAVTKSTVPATPGATEVDIIRSGASGVSYTVHRHRTQALLTEETTIVRTSGGATDGVTPLSWKVVTTANCNYSFYFECPPIAIWNDTTGSAVTATVECIAAAIGTDKEIWLDVEYLGDASSPQASFANDSADILATAANQTSSSETWGGSTAAFKLECTFTPQQEGWLYARVKIGKASSTLYIDPLITLS